VVDTPERAAGHVDVPTVAGDIATILRGLADHAGDRVDHTGWIDELRAAEESEVAAEAPLLVCRHRSDQAHPHLRRAAQGARPGCDRDLRRRRLRVVRRKYVEVHRPGTWLDTGPYGCLGNGLGYAIAARTVHPDRQVVVMLGDGAAGFSLMDVDSLVRHRLPVVMVVGNNGIWGLEKHPMQFIYGWDVACDLQPETRYDDVVRALGVPARRSRDPPISPPHCSVRSRAGVPYLVNVMTDPSDIYPRSSNLA
jgi:acetolactate synthase-1/2/3 large subunit